MYAFSMFFFLSLYFQDVLHDTAIDAGLSYLPLAAGIFVAIRVASRVVSRIGLNAPLIAGLLLRAVGLVWFARLPPARASFAADVLGHRLSPPPGSGWRWSRSPWCYDRRPPRSRRSGVRID
jgi:hypothetical protein